MQIYSEMDRQETPSSVILMKGVSLIRALVGVMSPIYWNLYYKTDLSY